MTLDDEPDDGAIEKIFKRIGRFCVRVAVIIMEALTD